MMSALIVVNLRGTINQRSTVKTTLEHLHLGSRYRATIIPDNPISKGMLQTVKNHVAWMDADSSIIESLITNRGEKSNSIKYDEDLAKKMVMIIFLILLKHCVTIKLIYHLYPILNLHFVYLHLKVVSESLQEECILKEVH